MKTILRSVDELFLGYNGNEQPLKAYATLMGLYGVAFCGFFGAVERGVVNLDEQISVGDILLMGIASHKIARIIALDEVTSALRAPFTEYEGESEIPAEVKEHPRGHGMQKAIGTLLTCPYCLAPWVGVAGILGVTFLPKITRTIGAIFAVAAISDWLNTGYDRAWKPR